MESREKQEQGQARYKMGDIKKNRKKYSTPSHPWQKARIDEEKEILKKYGLKNKKEIWKSASVLSRFKDRVKKNIALRTEQSEKEKIELLSRLNSLGLLEKNAKLEDVLSLKSGDILNRRLQTILFKSNLAKTIKQSRQFIIHGHVTIGEKKITAPGYLVLKKEESLINFTKKSSLSNVEHPERLKK